jgi:hypothetical protein
LLCLTLTGCNANQGNGNTAATSSTIATPISLVTDAQSIKETEKPNILPLPTNLPAKVETKIKNEIEGLILNAPITVTTSRGSILIASDNSYSNLWVLTSEAPPHPFFDISVYNDTFNKVQEKNNKEGRSENKLYLIRAAHPFPLSQEKKIVFESNNSSILSGIYNSSLHVINSDSSEEKVLADSKIYGNLQIVNVTKDSVVANNDNIPKDPNKFGLVIVNIETGSIKQYTINGRAYALSEDNKYVFFHKIKDGTLLNEKWMLNIETGKEKLAQ